jgi:hypothetical protein
MHIKKRIVNLTSPFSVLDTYYLFPLKSSFWTSLYFEKTCIPFYRGKKDGNIKPKKSTSLTEFEVTEEVELFPFPESCNVTFLFLQLFKSSGS